MARIHVLHENDEWLIPLRAAFRRQGQPWTEWHLDEGVLKLNEAPPEGVFYNRMSASSHTRGHRYAPEYTAAVLSWLESHQRRVINNSRALALEVSKTAQYASLQAHGVPVPATVTAVGRDAVLEAAADFPTPLILKHNRGGKGLGVRLVRDRSELKDVLRGPDYTAPIDGVTLVQQYIEAPEPFITRMEFIGGELVYAVRVNTSRGFELCPADVCETDPTPGPMFEVLPDFNHELVPSIQRFLAANGIHVAGVEFIADRAGNAYVYDVNTNTNYNAEAEAKAGISGMGLLARYLGEQLAAETAANQAA